MIVELNQDDLLLAAIVGVRRQVWAMTNKIKNRGEGSDAWFDEHIIGAMAELAVARILNLFWDHHIGDLGRCDVGGLVEVRCRRYPGTGKELTMKPDKDSLKLDRPFVHTLIDRDTGRIKLVGWLYGHEAKKRAGDAWVPKAGYVFVPPPYTPIEQLIAMFEPSLSDGAMQSANRTAPDFNLATNGG